MKERRGPLASHLVAVVADPGSSSAAPVAIRANPLAHKEATDPDNVELPLYLQHMTSSGILLTGPCGQFLAANQTALDLLGLTEADICSKTARDPDWDVIREDGTRLTPEEFPICQAIESRQSISTVAMGVARPGTPNRIWLLVSADPILGDDGTVVQVICMLTNITERKKLSWRSEEQYRTLLAAVPGVVMRIDRDLRYVYVSPSMFDILGMPAADFIGKRITDVHQDAETRRHWKSAIQRVFQTARAQEAEFSFPAAAGERTFHARLTPEMTDGEVTSVVSIAHDTTERKVTERALRRSNKRIANILESITDAFIALDRQGHFTYVNPKAEQLFQRNREALLGVNLWEAFPDAVDTMLYEQYHRTLDKQVMAQFETFYRPLGLWIQVHMYPSNDGLSIYFNDVTGRRLAEEELRHSVERLQRSVDGVVGAMAFAVEMRDPYTAGHQRRVSALACAIARVLGFTEEQVEVIRIAGLLHDIGKISIPAEILSKPGRLSVPELTIIQGHAQVGYEMLKGIEFPPPVALIALQHHERLDGSGYPAGLQRDDIISEAQILAVADVVEAMASHRPYRPALGIEKALEEIMQFSGVRYDTGCVDACLQVFAQSGFDFEQVLKAESERTGDQNG